MDKIPEGKKKQKRHNFFRFEIDLMKQLTIQANSNYNLKTQQTSKRMVHPQESK